ncbi:MAG: GatB/YqeY domain-containing protein [Deltaproteobacteria bacterium]|nr:GatB/YqeY domain-containing protein [Deltaproteobacteria bacterium]
MSEQDSLLARLDRALLEAMKARDAVRTSTLRMVRAALKNREIDKRAALAESDVLEVLASLGKQRRESIEQFQAGGRQDLVDKETAELKILQEFLPAELTEAELRELVRTAVAEVGAAGPRDMGKVMSAVMPRVKGRADGRAVNAMVREILSSGG